MTRSKLFQHNLSGTNQGEPSTGPPSCTTPWYPLFYDWVQETGNSLSNFTNENYLDLKILELKITC